MSILYVEGDATKPLGDDPCIVAHVCNDFGAWGRGFVLAITNRWTEPEVEYRRWSKGVASMQPPIPFELGQVQMVEVENNFWIANMVAQNGVGHRNGVPPIRYSAVEKCLTVVATAAKERNASVHMPRIGCGLAGGEWSLIERLVQERLTEQGISVTVYDLP